MALGKRERFAAVERVRIRLDDGGVPLPIVCPRLNDAGASSTTVRRLLVRAWVRVEDGVEGQSLWVWGTDAFYGGETNGRKVTRRKDWRGEEFWVSFSSQDHHDDQDQDQDQDQGQNHGHGHDQSRPRPCPCRKLGQGQIQFTSAHALLHSTT
ncbi:hypothetical protein MMC22_005660 [Lobaria immixta]|nr:hypothetical protein [Lobaria immixta]